MTESALNEHLAVGTSDVARCWILTRRDGTRYGFTDHDVDISIEGILCRANTGLSASAISQTTGLSVDNSEAVGALSDAAIRDEDLVAGRFDGAQVEAWQVQWSNPEARSLVFRGSLGEVTHSGQAFSVELRGLTEALNQPAGAVYNKSCSRILGDEKCGVDLSAPGFAAEVAIGAVEDARIFQFKGLEVYDAHWFELGTLTVLEGAAQGLSGVIKKDETENGFRTIELWAPLGAWPEEQAQVRLTAGCDKRMPTCRLKFNNLLNFRGFPDIPGDDWLVTHPTRARVLNGGSRR